MLLTAMTLAAAIAAQDAASCVTDRAAILALGYDAFDQTMDGGWRPIASRQDCRVEAADLIRDYRAAHADTDLDASQTRTLNWHEGQLRAFAGQAVSAVDLFARSYDDSPVGAAWNVYVDASIAFLQADLDALMAAHRRLEPMKPDEEMAAALRSIGAPADRAMNLDVVEGFIACFDKPYGVAYGAACRGAFAQTGLDGWTARHRAGFLRPVGESESG